MTNDREDGFRERLEQRDYEASVLRDRWLLTVAGVALGLSLTFIRDLGEPLKMPLAIVGAWICLGASVSTMLASLGQGRASMQEMMQDLAEAQTPTDNLARTLTKRLNQAAFWLLVFGLTLIVIFASFNLTSCNS